MHVDDAILEMQELGDKCINHSISHPHAHKVNSILQDPEGCQSRTIRHEREHDPLAQWHLNALTATVSGPHLRIAPR